MADRSGIPYVDATWNPVKGCSHRSSGCDACYAERQAARFGKDGEHFAGLTESGRWTGKAKLYEHELERPIRWTRPRRILVCSMGDLFHESVPDEWLCQVVDVIRESFCEQRIRGKAPHTFLLLTKRPERLAEVVRRMRWDGSAEGGKGRMWMAESGDSSGYRILGGRGCSGLGNLWLGVSVESMRVADRIGTLVGIKTPLRKWVSLEPLLGPVDLVKATGCTCWDGGGDFPRAPGQRCCIDWVVVGAETGPRARPMERSWAHAILAQCRRANVPFYMKQVDAKHNPMGDLDVRELPEWSARMREVSTTPP